MISDPVTPSSQLIDAPERRRSAEMDDAAIIEAGTDWAYLEAITDEENRANEESDPDAVILTPDERRRLRRVPDPRAIREQLGLTQRGFADRFGIPVGTLRDWEQGRRFVDATARTLLRTIARAPDVVAQANQPDVRQPSPDQRPAPAATTIFSGSRVTKPT